MSKDSRTEDWQGRTADSVNFSKRVVLASFGLAAALLISLVITYLLK